MKLHSWDYQDGDSFTAVRKVCRECGMVGTAVLRGRYRTAKTDRIWTYYLAGVAVGTPNAPACTGKYPSP